ncbi:CBS domain-containing protein [Halopseudomonas litoralis]|uniref:CBS domain-containing protein n=1 Tax=Halopseudomonas litoralis TaxID=797277 RepID=A0A1H1PY35_9GAMM|nr:putative nucleotidyltransferase substrate binding domain-containing protein [Halopseudomonas litoralis]SDS16026.1 CBS domain-containing protein [Halopseudomonas litoralis]
MNRDDSLDQIGRTAVKQNIHGTMTFLLGYPPFNQMESHHLAWLVEHCELRFYAQGDVIIHPAEGPVQHFHIVKQGRVRGERLLPSQESPATTFEISVGECFPLAALIGDRPTRTDHIAGEDTFCLLLPRADFSQLLGLSPVFRNFALRGVSSLLVQVNLQVQREAAEAVGAHYSLDTVLAKIAIRDPVTCSPDTAIGAAVKSMHEASVGSIVITDAQAAPIGIFTLRDLRRIVAQGQADLQQAIAEVMTQSPSYLPSSASAFDAAISMTREHIAHLCVVDKGRLVGVVSERDLFALQRVDLVHLARTISQAESTSSLVALRHDIHHLVDSMLAHGASAAQITDIITLLNDHTVCRAIELCQRQHGDPGIPFTWLCFGSEARREQTLLTDQDNGILFEADNTEQANAYRQRLLPLAQRINQALADCGFTLCKGNIMAGNPEMCLSRDEWHSRFSRYIQSTTPENLLASSIFFDFRVVWGEPGGAQALFRSVLGMVAHNRTFQHLLARNALANHPPIGMFRGFVVSRSGHEKDTLDLKTQGLTPFVDGARVLALANGISETGTLRRLHQLKQQGVIEALDADAYVEAYQFIQLVRMQQHQRQEREQLPFSNRLAPDTLNHLDRRILRESFRQAQRLQSSLALRYQL